MLDAQIQRILAMLKNDDRESTPVYFGEGWDNRLFLVDDDLILRIARTPDDNERLVREARTLTAIEPLLPLPVPHVEWVHHPGSDSPLAAMTYRKLSGRSLDAREVDADAATVLAPALAELLDDLHTIPSETARELGIPTFSPHGWLARHDDLVEVTREAVRARLDSESFERFDQWWNEYRSDSVAVDFVSSFIHGDLACEHVLVEHDPLRVTGVIDFGDAMLADPALDLAGFPDGLAREVLRQTRLAEDAERVWRRRSAYRRLGPLHAVKAGIERRDSALLDEGIAGLRQRFSA